jgi:microsomal dipeptidase-like Zn-dependent dipeptidase
LLSNDITLTAEQRYFSVLIGGTNDLRRERVELQVLANSSAETALARDGDYLVLFSATGRNTDLLHQEVFTIPALAAPRKVRIKIVDDSPDGHINADYIRFTSLPPTPHHAPAWGFADYHTHPMNYMAFGGLNNIHTVWGFPGGDYKDYEHDRFRINGDLPYCTTGHGGGPTAEVFINSADTAQIQRPHGFEIIKDLLAGHYTSHGRYGAPTFRDFPGFLTGAHHQMHITQIHRAWEGGLRLMTAFAVHNRAVEYLVSPVKDGKIYPSEERDVVEAQLCGIRRLASLNCDWIEIAYTPDDARRIIRENKLAIVLGIEVDRLSELGKGDAEHEIEYLWNLGIRHVFPIHAFNNKLGGPAVFEDAYNSANDLLNRKKLNMGVEDLMLDWHFFAVKEGCAGGTTDRGECVLYHLNDKADRVVITRFLPDFFLDRILPPILWKQIPFIKPVTIGYDDKLLGHMNQKGLCTDGIAYVRALMKKGMLIDLAHMSEQSVTDTYNAVGSVLKERGLKDCEHLTSKSKLSEVCYENAYPLTASHIHFRAQSLQADKTTYEPFLPREYEMSDSQLELLKRVGGVLGPFVAEDPIDPPRDQPDTSIKNDCAGSSKGFGYSFLYGLSKMGGSGVGLATDYTFIPSVAPRFGSNACWPYKRAEHPDKERALNPGMYCPKDQTDGVYYKDGKSSGKVRVGKNEGITRYSMNEREFDYNTDGLANYGLLPDFLQDLKNIGLPKYAFEALFSSSEDYLQMWEKIWKFSGITAGSMTYKTTKQQD